MTGFQTSQVQGHTGRGSGPRAGFWQRFAAAFIDGVLMLIVSIVLRVALGQVGAALSLLVESHTSPASRVARAGRPWVSRRWASA